MSGERIAIGVMQGRLVPRYQKRYQAFPAGYWECEFHIARELGFQNIEFILDYDTADLNPLMSSGGIQRIKDVCAQTGVGVRSICADYFMQRPFHSPAQAESERTLEVLIENASVLGVRDIVIPFVDQSSLKTADDCASAVNSIQKALPAAERLGVNINFETDLAPAPFRDFLARFQSPNIKVNYDTGNSASLGYDPVEELEVYGEFVSDLHIKDRVLGGGSVKLGTGNTEFEKVFRQLQRVGFRGTVTMQASRADNYIDDLRRLTEQLAFTRQYVEKYLTNNTKA